MREVVSEDLELDDSGRTYCRQGYQECEDFGGTLVICHEGLSKYYEDLPRNIRLHFQAKPGKNTISLESRKKFGYSVASLRVDGSKRGTPVFHNFANMFVHARAALGLTREQPVHMWVEVIG